ncbi:monooxygenase [Fomitopsis betulina]|nr:monooxygenase [Fomitopsis betulina]
MPQSATIPVLISTDNKTQVGAGPAGLVAALTLRKNGIPSRSQDLYRSLGVLDEILAEAKSVALMRMYKLPGGTEPLVTFSIDPHVEPTPSRPHALQQKGDLVEIQVTKRDGGWEVVETIRCRWLIGTDGARSHVRKQSGQSFDGESFNYQTVVGDLEVKVLDTEHWHYCGDMNTILVNLPAPEEGIIFQLGLGGQIDAAKVVGGRAELERVVRLGTGHTDIQIVKVRLIYVLRPAARTVKTFRVGRVFLQLAGDAAYVHPPFGDQGLNSSVQDSAKLAWKLALVEKGVAEPSLLDTYTEERVPVIAEMLNKSSGLFNNFAKSQATGAERQAAWRRGGDLHRFGVHRRWSYVVLDERSAKEDKPFDPYGRTRTPEDVVRAGEPMLRTTTLFDIFGISHHLLVWGDGTEKSDAILDTLRTYPTVLLRTVLIRADTTSTGSGSGKAGVDIVDQDGHAHEGYQVQKDKFLGVIVRPDGVVGAIVHGSDDAKRYFDGVFRAL